MFIILFTLALTIKSYKQIYTQKRYGIMDYNKQKILNYDQEFNITNVKYPKQKISLEIKNNNFNITMKKKPSTVKFIESVNGGLIITINSRPICKIYDKIIPCGRFETPHEFKLDFKRINGENAVIIKDTYVENDLYNRQNCISLQENELRLAHCDMMKKSQLWIMLEKTIERAEKLKNIYNMGKMNKLCNILESEIIKKKSKIKPNKTVIITTEYNTNELSDDSSDNVIVDCSYNDILSNLNYACYTKYNFLNFNDNNVQPSEDLESNIQIPNEITNNLYDLENRNLYKDPREENDDDLLEKLSESCYAQQLMNAKLNKKCTGLKNIYKIVNGKLQKNYIFAQPSDYKMDLYYKKGEIPKCNIELFMNYILNLKNELKYPEGVDISGCEKLAQMLIDIN